VREKYDGWYACPEPLGKLRQKIVTLGAQFTSVNILAARAFPKIHGFSPKFGIPGMQNF